MFRLGNRLAFGAQFFDVQLDCLAHVLLGFLHRCADADAARQVWDDGAPIRLALLKDNNVFVHWFFSIPACFSIAFNVPVGISSDSFPGTTTIPDFVLWRIT